MSYWAFSSLVNLAASLFLGLIVIIRNPRAIKNVTFALCCFVTAIWSLPYFLWQTADSHDWALFYCRALMVGGIFVPICYFHHFIAVVDKLDIYLIYIYLYYFNVFTRIIMEFS